MNLQTIPIDQLQPAPYNPRVTLRPGMPAYARLARSLTEFELVQPIVWNQRTSHVVGGHQRLQILRDRGATAIPCVVVDLPLEREKALNIALNNEQVGGAWDTGKLVDLVAELRETPDFDVTLTGFSEQDLKHLLFVPPDEEDDLADPPGANLSRVVLEFPSDRWPQVRVRLDQLLNEGEGTIVMRCEK